MSDNVMSVGFMAPLITPLVKRSEELELLRERLWGGSDLEINYEGTLVYSAENNDVYGLHFGTQATVLDFLKQLDEMGLSVDTSRIVFYTCLWYDGSYSDMSMLTLEEFTEQNA